VDLSTVVDEAGTAATATFDLSGVLGTDYSAEATNGVFQGDVAVAAGATNIDFTTGTPNNSLTLGVAVDGGSVQNVVLDQVYADRDALLSAINGALTDATATFDSSDFLVITSDSTGSTSSVAVTEVAAGGDGAAFDLTSGASTAGDDAAAIDLVFADPNDGNVTVSLGADLSTGTTAEQSAALVAAITGALGGEFTATGDDAGNVTVTDAAVDGEFTAGDFTLTVDGAPTAATSSTTGVGPTTLTLTDLTITFGDSDAITLVEASTDFASQQELVDAINSALGSNGTATLDTDSNTFTIVSGEVVTIGGADAATVFSAASFTPEGSLDDVSVTTVEASNATIQAVDATLSTISDLRSTFGAIQNRFESTIANLATTTENLEASRSRIRDADFAAETAALARAQILQQAGIAVLAQANAQQQNVLALLQ
jgi:flagellin